MFAVMRLRSPVVLSHLDAGFEPRCGRKDFWTACLRLLLLATVRRIVLKRLIFTSKWITVWHHGMVEALLNTHLPSFESPISMEEERPSLPTRT